MEEKIKFFQITASDGILYALDGGGQVWSYDPRGWYEVPHPTREVKPLKPTPTLTNGRPVALPPSSPGQRTSWPL